MLGPMGKDLGKFGKVDEIVRIGVVCVKVLEGELLLAGDGGVRNGWDQVLPSSLHNSAVRCSAVLLSFRIDEH